jgi:hypothetical protein
LQSHLREASILFTIHPHQNIMPLATHQPSNVLIPKGLAGYSGSGQKSRSTKHHFKIDQIGQTRESFRRVGFVVKNHQSFVSSKNQSPNSESNAEVWTVNDKRYSSWVVTIYDQQIFDDRLWTCDDEELKVWNGVMDGDNIMVIADHDIYIYHAFHKDGSVINEIRIAGHDMVGYREIETDAVESATSR